ncbi:MAG: flagellar assembly protein FliW [Bryobacteraceae bacterium]
MPVQETQKFGRISYGEGSEIDFPAGLPGFEERRRFLAVQLPDTHPLVFLQSLDDPGLCFVTLPVLAVEPKYRLRLSGEDLERLGLSGGRQPRIGPDVLCLTVVSIRVSGPTANLLAPVVVNVANLKAVQAVMADSGYSHQHALSPQEAAVCS